MRLTRWGAAVGLALAVGPLLGTSAAWAGTVGERPVSGSWGPYKSCGAAHPGGNCATVRAIAAIGSRTYVAGDFTGLASPGGGSRHRVQNLAAVDAAGRPVRLAGHRFDGSIRALATDGTRLFVGGTFRHVDGRPARYLAAFTPAGKLLRYPGAGGVVRALAVQHGSLYVGTSTVRKLTARTGKVDGRFIPPRLTATTVGAQVWSLAVGGSRLYVGGHFTGPRLSLLAVDRGSGAVDPGFAPPVYSSNPDDPLLGIASLVAGGGGVYAGQEGHTNRAYRFSSTGSMVWGVVPDGDVQAVEVSNGTVYLGGHFTCLNYCGITGELPRDHIAAMTTDGQVTPWNPGMGSTSAPYYYGVWSVQMLHGALWAGGVFNNVTAHGTSYPTRKMAIFR